MNSGLGRLLNIKETIDDGPEKARRLHIIKLYICIPIIALSASKVKQIFGF